MLSFQVTKERGKHWLVLLKQWAHCCPALSAAIPCYCTPSLNCSALRTSTTVVPEPFCSLCSHHTGQRGCRCSLQPLVWSMRGRHFPKTSRWHPSHKQACHGVRDALHAKQRCREGYGWLSCVIVRDELAQTKRQKLQSIQSQSNPQASDGIHPILMTRFYKSKGKGLLLIIYPTQRAVNSCASK